MAAAVNGNGKALAAKQSSSSGTALPLRTWIYMLALGVQYGAQPLLSKRFSGKEVIVTSAVLACEWAKVACALIALTWNGSLWNLGKDWTLSGALIASGLPAALYALQNTLLQLGYRNLDSLTFSMLNQTKILFTALFMYIVLGHRQSKQQMGALIILLLAAFFLCLGQKGSSSDAFARELVVSYLCVAPVLAASLLSGLASALCQWAAQVKRRSSYLQTMEMSAIGSLCLVISMLQSPDGASIMKRGFFSGWTVLTFIPVFTNAIGGILVGLITSQAGGVRKGFVIVSGLLVTALLQVIFDGVPPSSFTLAALPLVVCSVLIYQRYPYQPKKKKE